MTQKNYDALVFDCDGTLSSVEGIVELARWNGVEQQVATLTEKAMGDTGMTTEIYEQRISQVKPSHQQCEQLAEHYYQQRTPGIESVIQKSQQLDIAVFVISAGVNPAVLLFAEHLNIKQQNVHAVDLQFDDKGHYLDYDHSSPMTQHGGKRLVVEQIKQRYPKLLYIGDGKNDLDVYDDVDTFIGYGGAYYRESIKAACKHYISEKSLASLLELI